MIDRKVFFNRTRAALFFGWTFHGIVRSAAVAEKVAEPALSGAEG